MRKDDSSSLISKLSKSLKVQGAADRRDIRERLEGLGVADFVTVVEDDDGRHEGITGDDSRNRVRLGV